MEDDENTIVDQIRRRLSVLSEEQLDKVAEFVEKLESMPDSISDAEDETKKTIE